FDESRLGDAVELDFEPAVVLPERGREPLGRLPGLFVVALTQVERDLAGEAGRQAYDALAVRREDVLVDARTAIEAFEIPDGAELDQVPVSGPVLRQQHQVTVLRRGPGGLLGRGAGPEGEVRLES